MGIILLRSRLLAAPGELHSGLFPTMYGWRLGDLFLRQATGPNA